MSLRDLLVLAGCAVVGFGVVSWIISLVRQQRAPPFPMQATDPAGPTPRATLSVAQLGTRWHTILGVDPDADSATIETAYHARLAECERTRLAPTASAADKQVAELFQNELNQAFEFIRSSIGGTNDPR